MVRVAQQCRQSEICVCLQRVPVKAIPAVRQHLENRLAGRERDQGTGVITMNEVEFQRQRKALIAYMQVKMVAGDWHAVSDAANDMRELLARYEGFHSGLINANGVRTAGE